MQAHWPSPGTTDSFKAMSKKQKSPEEYRSTRALHVMLVNHLSHHIMYVRQTVPVRRHSCGDEHRCPLMTALNALIRCAERNQSCAAGADDSLPKRM